MTLDLERIARAGGEVVEAALDPRELAALALNDTGNAVRFAKRFGHRFLFVPGLGWYAFAGTHWSNERGESLAYLAACETVALINDEAAAEEAAGHDGRAKLLRAHATKSGNIQRLGGLLRLAQEQLPAMVTDFDREPYALNVLNGTLRFECDPREGWFARLDPHRATDMLSRVVEADYAPGAPAPLWEKHITKMQPDPVMRDYLQRIFGYTLLGHGNEQAFFIFQGRGGDGKSTTVNTIRRVLGSYAAVADVRTFLQSKNDTGGDKASPALASLAGDYRLLSTSEPPKGAALNEGLVKAATGGAPLKVRHLNRGLFEYIPAWKIMLECNSLPFVPGEDDGIWRRAKLITWRVQLKRHQMDSQLEGKLAREAGGVLNWLVAGALEYLERGLDEPELAREALNDFRRGSNVFGEWAAEWLVFDPKASQTQKTLYASFEEFCVSRGYEVLSTKGFGKALSNLQIITRDGPGSRSADKARDWIRFGARLKTAEEIAGEIDEARAGLKSENAQSEAPESVAEFETV